MARCNLSPMPATTPLRSSDTTPGQRTSVGPLDKLWRSHRKNSTRFHAALDKFLGGKYARAKGTAAFKDLDRAEVIKDLTEFKTAEGGIFKEYLPGFLAEIEKAGP